MPLPDPTTPASRFAEMRALALYGPLLSEAEKTEHHAAVAAQRARDEAQRAALDAANNIGERDEPCGDA